MTLRRMGLLPARTRFRSSITRLTSARRGRLFTGLVVMALLFVQAAPASSGVFDDLGGGFSGPSISSDRADYLPGDTVVLSGSGWLPAEHVHITVNDDVGQTWARESDVTADESGTISDDFQLPDSFIAQYRVTAVGDASGNTALRYLRVGETKC